MLYPLETPTRELKSLDGIWRLCFDSERRGEDARYFEAFPQARSIEIAVPGSINEQVVDREQHLSLDWVWYQTSFRVPESWPRIWTAGWLTNRCPCIRNPSLCG